jgi:hypothetical protein
LTAEPTTLYTNALDASAGFEGQLTDDFQARLAGAFAGVGPDQCDFYHTMELGPGEVVRGVWDLRGRERSYLGHVDVRGLRVLEFGPATGYLSFYMEKQDADMVCFDLPPGMATDIVPQEGHDIDAHKRLSVGYMERVRNSWWYGRRRLGARARAVYGDIYGLPSDLRRFDVTTFGSILMHLSRPFSALQQAAALTDKALIVTEPIPRVPADPDAALMEFAPMGTHETVVHWWQLTPGVLMRMLRVFGFLEFTVSYHLQTYHPKHEMDKPPVEALFFTLVAERHKGWAPRLEITPEERAAEAALRVKYAPVDAAGDEVKRLRAELSALQASASWRWTRPLRAAGSLLRRAGLR